ncbi:hypothetical protein ACOJVU_01680 [Mycobacterium sp. THU-M104]|uniref:putative alpha/beta hydrolase n=1 Tax=Mycobacterium sp. THU-M104 TaxID=3410515 RepID=UPI003B9C40D6
MQLRYISVPALIAEAHGDPWSANRSMQAGRPIQIAELAEAFHDAGRCTTEASAAFGNARRRFEASWNRGRSDHPINDSAEVQRATQSLGVPANQLPMIAVDLENIAAALAEVQKTGAVSISTLEACLQQIDGDVGEALEVERVGHLTAAELTLVDQHIHDLETEAIIATKSTLGKLQALLSDYSDYLQASLTTLRVQDGYDPAPIQGLDADGQPSNGDQDQDQDQDQQAVGQYISTQRTPDEALVNDPATTAGDKSDAAARLRDYATATSPTADTEARRLAGERIGDFAMAHFIGPLPVNPILGGDARGRALMRLGWQKKLEQGFSVAPPMAPDQATQMLDNAEQQARAVVTGLAVKGLEAQGMSHSGAMTVVRKTSRGIPWADVAKQQGQIMSLSSAGINGMLAARGGRHAVDAFTPADVVAFEKVAKTLNRGGNLTELILAGNDWRNGASLTTTVAKTTGSIAGGWLGSVAGGATLGTVIGPEGAFAGAVIGAALFGYGGERAGEVIGGLLDK